MQPSPRVLILTASVGAGHLRAAEAVQLAIQHLAPDALVKNVDILTHSTKAFRKVYAQAYLDLVNKAPHALGWFYDLTDRAPSPRSKSDKLRLLVQRWNLRELDEVLYAPAAGTTKAKTVPWDMVVHTHFLPAEIIARLKRKRAWPTPSYTVVTDFDAHGLWANDPTDRYFVATEEAALSLGRWGVRPETITVTGIPIHPVFSESKSPNACRERHGLAQDRPVILLLAGGFGVGPIEQLHSEILKVSKPLHVCVVCGKNEGLRKKLDAMRPPAPHRSTVLGFTREMDELVAAADIVVTKPGGLTTSEVLARGAAMAIVNPIPGQESRNSDYLLENGAAIKINNASALAYKLGRVLGEGTRLDTLRTNAKRLGRPYAAIEVAKAVLDGAAASSSATSGPRRR